MKKILLTVSTFIVIQFLAQGNEIVVDTIGHGIDHSGKTRMLSMRLAALFAAQSSDRVPDAVKKSSKKKQVEAQTLMNNIYAALIDYGNVTKNKKLIEKVTKATDVWSKMEKTLSRETSAANLIDVLSWSEKVLKVNQDMTHYLDTLSSNPSANIVDISGAQRMYAMRLARDYLAASIGVDKENRMDLMLETATNFESSLLVLESSEVNTSKITGMINSIAKMEWRHVYESVTKCVESSGTEFNELIMLKFTDKLLEKSDKLTHLYSDLFSS